MCINGNAVNNNHPTVKPLKLMRYLVQLITPPKGIVLDPFCGSGTTGLAATSLGIKSVIIEKELEYFLIAKQRNSEKPLTEEEMNDNLMEKWKHATEEIEVPTESPTQSTLF